MYEIHDRKSLVENRGVEEEDQRAEHTYGTGPFEKFSRPGVFFLVFLKSPIANFSRRDAEVFPSVFS